MRTFRIIFVALALAAFGLSSGCSHGTTAAEISRIPELPIASLVDREAVGVVRVDLATVSASPVYANISDWIDLGAEDLEAPDRAMIRTALRAREFALFLVETSDGPRSAVILRGHYTMEDAQTFQREGLSRGERRRGPFLIHDQGENTSLVLFGTHTLVLGDEEVVDGIVSRQIGDANGGYPRNEAFVAIANRVGFETSPIGFVVVPPESLRQSQESDPVLRTLASARAIGVGIDVRGELVGRAVITLDSSIMAMAAVTLGRAQIAGAAEEAEMQPTGLVPMISRIQLDRDGSSVVVELTAPQEEARRSFGAFTEFLRSQGH